MRLGNLKIITCFELKRFWNNKPLLILVGVAPILICAVFGFVAYTYPRGIDLTVSIEHPPLKAVHPELLELIREIREYKKAEGAKTFSVNLERQTLGNALQKLNDGKTRAVIFLRQGPAGLEEVLIVMDVTELAVSNEIAQALVDISGRYAKKISLSRLTSFLRNHPGWISNEGNRGRTGIPGSFDSSFHTSAWTDLGYFDFHASAMMVVLAMSIPLSLSLMTITSERMGGTLERIFVTPYGKAEILGGKMLAFSVLAVIIALLVTITLKALFTIALGNSGLILLTTILVGINGVVFGLLVSSRTRTDIESITVGILCIFAFMGLMTFLVPWETMHPSAKFISRLLPFTYGIRAIRLINMTGAGFYEIWMDLTVLLASIFIQLSITIPVLRREIN
ncbi:MAG: ABC transporter permease [Thermodesulfobacteriota bacterium]